MYQRAVIWTKPWTHPRLQLEDDYGKAELVKEDQLVFEVAEADDHPCSQLNVC